MTNIVFVLHSRKLWVSKLEQPENGCDKILRLGKNWSVTKDQGQRGATMRQQGCERCCSPCSLVHHCNWSDHRSARLGCHTMKLRTIAEVHSRPRAVKMWWFTLMHLQCALAAALSQIASSVIGNFWHTPHNVHEWPHNVHEWWNRVETF